MSNMEDRIDFKIETAENMAENKIIILTNPCNKELLVQLLDAIEKDIRKHLDEE